MTTYDDQQFMARAIELAQRGLYTTAPNPRVGCVIVQTGAIIGEGWHITPGAGHAEVNALADVKTPEKLRGSTVYVTLEPCSHTGKTPPCVEALIKAGVSRVVSAMEDPNPLVAGSGHQRLRAAGIDVEVGLLAAEAAALNPGFNKRMSSGLPWLRMKMAMSLDGRTAMASGESQWITGPAARSDVQRLRARSCAIVTGIGTAIDDDPALTVRAAKLELPDAQHIASRQPLRVVVDSQLRLPPAAKLLQQPGRTIIVCAARDTKREASLIAAGAEVLYLPASQEPRVDLRQLMSWLGSQNCNEVLLEAGATLAGAFWQAGLIDALTIYMAPTLLGSQARALLELPFERMNQQQRLCIKSIVPVGSDWRIDAIPENAFSVAEGTA